MKYLLIVVLLSFVSCQDLNSNTGDESKYGPLNLTGSTEFNAAYRVMRDRCFTCHYHQSWATWKTETEWETRGKVIPQDPDNSSLINRIKNYGASDSDMPTDDGPLEDDEYDTLVEWVNNFP